MKILHISTDNRFINQAIKMFEQHAPGQNDVWIFTNETLKLVDFEPTCIYPVKELKSLQIARLLDGYNAVILHSFPHVWVPLVKNARVTVRFVWIGWGYDYYAFMLKKPLYLPRTQRLLRYETLKNVRSFLRGVCRLGALKRVLTGTTRRAQKTLITHKVAYFAPVLESEYTDMQKDCPDLPPYLEWNYASFEDDLLKGQLDKRCTGRNILVGNSATPTCNHLETFELLSGLPLEGRKVVVPLSYGEQAYRHDILRKGSSLLGNRFQPLLDLMPIERYLDTIASCDIAIMSHMRQQSLGNIAIMLYLGAKVYLREENPIYPFLKARGAHVYPIQDLEQGRTNGWDTPLTKAQMNDNRRIVIAQWGRQAANRKTAYLIEVICGERSHV